MVRKLSGNMRIRVHRFLPVTEAEGPGQRAALWVQGCPIRCPGCFNRQTWSFRKGCWRTVGDLFRQIAEHPGLEGVTFTGGEPFAQARPLAALGRACRDAGLSVVTYTGYNYGRVRRSKRRDWKALLDVTDLLLAGPFVKELVDSSRPWVGSSNQEFVFLTDKYCHLNENCAPSPNNLEVRIDKLSGLSLNGTAPESDIKAIRQELARLGVHLSVESKGAS